MVRFISDENISWRLKKLIPRWEILPANEIKANQRLSDFNIWQFAKSNNYNILTFDEDFSELQNLYSFPPKIVWLRVGNASTVEIKAILLSKEAEIIHFLSDDTLGVFEIYL